MKHFAVQILDQTDENALERRMTHRQTHLDHLALAVKAGTFLSGGAILNEQQVMIGSALHLAAESEDAIREMLANDIFAKENVWDMEQVSIVAFKRFPVESFL